MSGASPETIARLAEAMRRVSFLATLAEADLARLAAHAVEVEATAGTVLLRQGEAGDTAWLLLEGEADVLADGPLGADRVGEILPGQFIGEMGALASVPRSATVVARTPLRLLRLDQAVLHRLLLERPEVAAALIRDLAHRLVAVMRPLSDLMQAAQALERADMEPALLDMLAERAGEMTPFAQAFGRMVRAVAARRDARREMEMAARLQRAILPEAPPVPPGYALDGQVIPARAVGGDFWDAFELPGGRLAILVADVSGKGAPAAFFMGIARTAIRAVATGREDGAAAILARANALLADDNREMMFVCLFLGILDAAAARLDWASAGHPPGFLLRADGIERLAATGPLLGIAPGARFGSGSAALRPGDRLFLYTDGVTEAMDAAGGFFGEARLLALLPPLRDAGATALNAAVMAAVDRFAAGAPQADDITCLTLAVSASPTPAGPAASS